MSSIVPFAYGDQSIRVLNLNGEPWFVLAAGDVVAQAVIPGASTL